MFPARHDPNRDESVPIRRENRPKSMCFSFLQAIPFWGDVLTCNENGLKSLFFLSLLAQKVTRHETVVNSGRATTVGGRYVGRMHFDFSSTLVRH